MAIKLVSSDKLATSNGVKIIVYGRAGVGKTMLTATMPKPVLISAESGLLSLKKENIEKVFGPDRDDITYEIPVIEIKTLDDLIEAEEWCRTSKEANWFDSVCIDSITEIGEKVLANAKEGCKDPRQAYGVLIDQMLDVIKKFRDIKGKHVYMSAKESRFKDEGSGLTLFGPEMPGAKLGQAMPYLPDEVFNINVGKDDGEAYRYLRTAPDMQYDAKDRSGALEVIEYPHLGDIIAKIVNNNEDE